MTAPRQTTKQFLQIAAGILLSLFFIWLALRNVDFAKLLRTFGRVQPGWLVLGGGLVLLAYFFRALLWRGLLRRYPVRLWNLFRIITVGYLANGILPLRLGEVIRAWLLSRKENLPTSLALGTVVIERGMDLVSLFVFFLFMMFFVPFQPWLKLSGLILAGFGLVLFLALGLNYRYGGHLMDWIEKPLQRLPGKWGSWLHAQLDKFLQGLKLLESPGQLLQVLGFALAGWLAWTSVVYVCFLALGLPLNFMAAMFLIVVLNFGLMLPSSPGGLGIFEFMIILGLGPYGISKEAALGLGFTFHMLQYILTLIVGWIFALQLNVSMFKLYRQSGGDAGLESSS
ncbi:MAG: lysylphosphatidylglycerol synthase transmembrane domain-containing protein [candidate division FCPU426 bacterium]